MGRQEVAELCKKTKVKDLGPKLIEKCLEKASQDSHMTVEEIKAKPPCSEEPEYLNIM